MQLTDLSITHGGGTKAFVATQAGSGTSAASWQLVDPAKPTVQLPYLSFLANRKTRGSLSRDKGSFLIHIPKADINGLITSTTTFQVISNIPRDKTQTEVESDYAMLIALLQTALIKSSLVQAITPH